MQKVINFNPSFHWMKFLMCLFSKQPSCKITLKSENFVYFSYRQRGMPWFTLNVRCCAFPSPFCLVKTFGCHRPPISPAKDRSVRARPQPKLPCSCFCTRLRAIYVRFLNTAPALNRLMGLRPTKTNRRIFLFLGAKSGQQSALALWLSESLSSVLFDKKRVAFCAPALI